MTDLHNTRRRGRVEMLREADALLIAKLATGELASGDQWFGGQTKNPWDPTQGSSGSSAGPSSATAAECVGFAIGTETARSILRPAASCGLAGLRPTFGRISRTAPQIGDQASKGCTSASSWRDYPFLRMPNVRLEAGPKGSPNVEQMIADTKDGVLIDGRGSYSIDQQRYNGQFGGNCFWEIKNGRKTRMVSDVTYNAITTDFWANLDAIGSQETWKMFGTGGDAKGQPTQTNSISHGSPYIRIKKIMVGAAYV